MAPCYAERGVVTQTAKQSLEQVLSIKIIYRRSLLYVIILLYCWVAHLVSHIKGRTQDENSLEHDVEEDIWNNENFCDLHFHSNASD